MREGISMNTAQSKTAKEAEKATADAEALAAEIAALREDFKGLAAQVAKVGRAGAEELTEKAKAKAKEQYAKGEAIAHQVEGEIEALNDRVVEATRENPWRALGTAALAGIVLGLLIRR
jgi:ElaB/YqjD/DUF883 family membrane-anchored ribosome-binding protein